MIAPLRDGERRDLTEVIEDRAERASTLIASQLPVTDWHAVIGDANQADAICDRLLHDAHRHRAEGALDATDAPRPEGPHDGDDMSIPAPASTPTPRQNPDRTDRVLPGIATGACPPAAVLGPLWPRARRRPDVVDVRASRLSPVRYVTVRSSRGIDERGAGRRVIGRVGRLASPGFGTAGPWTGGRDPSSGTTQCRRS